MQEGEVKEENVSNSRTFGVGKIKWASIVLEVDNDDISLPKVLRKYSKIWEADDIVSDRGPKTEKPQKEIIEKLSHMRNGNKNPFNAIICTTALAVKT